MGLFDGIERYEAGNYLIVTAPVGKLVEIVNDAMKDGWVPTGGAVEDDRGSRRMTQTLIRMIK